MRLLIVGTLEGPVTEAGRIAHRRGARVAHIEGIDGALAALRSGQGADLVLCDVRLDVSAFIAALKAERIHVPVVACGVGVDSATAVRAIKAGAKDYLPLPPNAELIAAMLQAVTEESHTLVAEDPAMQSAILLAERMAPSDASILITGESGTGKEVIARHIHRKSKRAKGPFVSVNCAAIPEALLESELFGHEKGAFTGAVARRLGKFEEANGGTLLLDEISEMDLRLQAKLLRALQEREIDRIGGAQPVKVDIRILATSNRDLEAQVRGGLFREDLFFRLNVMTLLLPPLRERPADIVPLATYFARKYAASNGLADLPLSEGAAEALKRHPWRGNVRELENTMHRAVLLARGDDIQAEAIMMPGSTPAAAPNPASAEEKKDLSMVGRKVADVERDLIIGTLSHCLGNRTHTANLLGISIRTLRNKLRQYSSEGISVPQPGIEADEARA
ncbi:MAG: sigma-54-dependent Fis family transcriptional regulator [Alphaproteobacteria bacterium]|nr:MAG: sigma-54-dependent Fis family transcriptional regulator [Alphaproteobacteria bacterium]